MGAIYWIGTVIGIIFGALILLGPYAVFIIAGLILAAGAVSGIISGHKKP